MMVDIAGRAVRRHLKKANDQIGAIKERLDLADAGGMVILMNNVEPMIDVTMIGYAVQRAFEAVDSSYPHVDYIWASVECHRLQLSHGRLGFPQLHIAKNFENTDHLELVGDMLAAWAECNRSRLEALPFDRNWAAVRPVYFDGPPVLSPFSSRF